MNIQKQKIPYSLLSIFACILLFSQNSFAEDLETEETAQSQAEAAQPKAKQPKSTEAQNPATSTSASTPEEVQAPKMKAPQNKVPREAEEPLYGKEDRPLGDFLLGPYVTGLAIPRPLAIGIEGKYADTLGFSSEYGMLPQVTISSIKAKITGWDVRLKWYPWKGAFFLGTAFGSQNIVANKTEVISGITTTGTVDQDNTFLAPHIGWNWVWSSGFYMGLDLGVQFSLGRTTSFTTDVTNSTVLNSTQYATLQSDILDKADQFGKTPLPLITLLKIGYFF